MFYLKKKKNVLVLSSGAARGLAHLGVLRRLIEAGIEFDGVIGSSMGAIIGAYFALNKEIEGLVDFALEIDWQKLLKALDVNIVHLAKGGLVLGDKSIELLRPIFGNSHFSDVRIPFACVATKLSSGEPVILQKNEILPALRASYSIPGIFVPVEQGGDFLIDGGVSSPVPVDEARSLWGDNCRLWVVNVLFGPPKMNSKNNNVWDVLNNIYGQHSKFVPSVMDVLSQSVFIMESAIARAQSDEAYKLISPDTSDVHFMDFTKGRELVKLGYMSATKII